MLGADAHQDEEGEHRGQQAPDKIDQAGADQVAHAFHVGHDARHQHAGAGGVVEADRETADVLLHLHAQVGDQPLGGLREQLGQGKRGDGLDGGRQQNRADDPGQFVGLLFDQDVVDQELGGRGQNQPGDAVDDHQHKPKRQQPSARLDQGPDLRQHLAQGRPFFLDLVRRPRPSAHGWTARRGWTCLLRRWIANSRWKGPLDSGAARGNKRAHTE